MDKYEKYEKCPYCDRRMCGMATGSTICEPDLYRRHFSEEEVKIFAEDWDIFVEEENKVK